MISLLTSILSRHCDVQTFEQFCARFALMRLYLGTRQTQTPGDGIRCWNRLRLSGRFTRAQSQIVIQNDALSGMAACFGMLHKARERSGGPLVTNKIGRGLIRDSAGPTRVTGLPSLQQSTNSRFSAPAARSCRVRQDRGTRKVGRKIEMPLVRFEVHGQAEYRLAVPPGPFTIFIRWNLGVVNSMCCDD